MPSFISSGFIVVVCYFPVYFFDSVAAAGFTSGALLGYAGYMFVHHATHHWKIEPGDWLYEARVRHMSHHYHDSANFGVSTGFWDRVFGTARAPRGRLARNLKSTMRRIAVAGSLWCNRGFFAWARSAPSPQHRGPHRDATEHAAARLASRRQRTSANCRESDLRALADELRAETISAVSVTGGHLGAGLGVVELTVALHYVFDTPRDRLIWDVGHQAYPHKILTGRRERIRTLRQGGGLSGFTKRAESEYDPFGAAHSSTSISAGLGMAVARDLGGGDNAVVAVIGDGAMSAGMAYEAMNNAGALQSRLIVILNDNDMSIAPPTGAMSAYLARLVSSRTYLSLRDAAKQLARRSAEILLRQGQAGRGIRPRLLDRRHACSRSSASITSGRSTATTSTTCCRS